VLDKAIADGRSVAVTITERVPDITL